MHPAIGFVGAVVLLISGLLISVLLDKAGVEAIVIACGLMTIVSTVAILIGFSTARQVFLDGLSRVIAAQDARASTELGLLLRALSANNQRISALLQTGDGGQLTEGAAISDSQFAMLEAGITVNRVILVLRHIGTEFQEELEERKALIDYQRIVMDNLERGVRYTYVTEHAGKNLSRAQRVVRKVGIHSGQLDAVFLSTAEWEAFVIPLDTIFLVDASGEMKAYLLLPNNADKANRLWTRLSPDHTDEWWSKVEPLLARAAPLANLGLSR